jgi:nicotinate-nucleotide adenylyltransferase
MRKLGLDEVWWLVSPQNPLKPSAGMASLKARLASAKAAARHPRIRVSAVEKTLGTRYTVDTVHALQRRHPNARFIWLGGADILGQFHRWHEWRRLAKAIPLAIFARPAHMGSSMRAPAMAWLRRWRRPAAKARRWTDFTPPAIMIFNTRLSTLSATSLRKSNPTWYNTLETAAQKVRN